MTALIAITDAFATREAYEPGLSYVAALVLDCCILGVWGGKQ